jgi:GNAT superfamily N-acetyltransferase
MLTVARLSGAQMRERLEDLARLRITVFRDWPYLYEGTMEHEREYLPRYPDAKTGTLIVARDGDTIVGASTALGLDEESDYVRKPFEAAGMELSRIFYFGESVLLPQYRGQGVGVTARRRSAAWCAPTIIRPARTTMNRWMPSGATAAISGAATWSPPSPGRISATPPRPKSP